MITSRTIKTLYWALAGSSLMALGGCLGPNPGFFVSTTAANAAISTIVSTFVGNAINMGGG